MNAEAAGTTAGNSARARGRHWRRLAFEVLLVFAVMAVFWSLSAYVEIREFEQKNLRFSMFRLITNEATSGLSAFTLVPLILYWLNRFPISIADLKRAVPAHLLGAVLFALMHVALMMAYRELVYFFAGLDYVHAIPPGEFGVARMLVFEAAKDIPTYLFIIALIMLYRAYRVVDLPTLVEREANRAPRALKVKTGTGEKRLALSEVDWLQSEANYIRVFSGDREYLLRSTMGELEAYLDGTSFARTHRSYMVNRDAIDELRRREGRTFIRLKSGVTVPLSRRYRDSFQ